jgi:hypothetical protein
MRSAEEIERDILELPGSEYVKLRDWFHQREAVVWDAQIEADVRAGRLDALAAQARQSHAEGKTTKL